MARTKTFNRDQALDKALQVFWQRGHAATSLDDLQQQMGVGRQSLYDTFGDKRALYLQALDRYSDQHLASVQGALMRSGSVKRAVREIFEAIARLPRPARQKGCLLVNTAIELAPHDVDMAAAVTSGFRALEDAFTQALERGRSTGEVDRHVETRATAKVLVTLMHGMYVAGKAGVSPEALGELARSAGTLVK